MSSEKGYSLIELLVTMVILVIVLIAVALVVFLLATSPKIVQEYERGVIFRLGRPVGARGPDLFILIPRAST